MVSRTVTLLGLGNMGRALARAMKARGYDVIVWSRSDRSATAAELRVDWNPDIGEAIHSSEAVLACLSSYAATREVLDLAFERASLRGKSLIQLSTGLPDEAATLSGWAADRGLRYLDGKIAVVPASIGQETAVIFYSGLRQVFDDQQAVLRALGGSPTFVGEDPRAASMADFGFLCFFFLSTIGALYGASFYKAAGLDERTFLNLVPYFQADVAGRLPAIREAVSSGDFSSEIQSTLNVDLNGAELLLKSAKHLKLSRDPAWFIVDCFKSAVDQGFGKMDTSALTKIFDLSAIPLAKSV